MVPLIKNPLDFYKVLPCKWLMLKFGPNLDIGMMVRVFANGPGDLGSIPGQVIPKTFKMVFDDSLLNTQLR